MKAGKLDRIITLMRRETTQDPVYHTTIEGDWTDFATVSANVQDDLPPRGESVSSGIAMATQTCRIEIHYRNDITSDMRLTIEGRTGEWRIITPPAEYGRREGLIFKAEQLTTEGQEP